MQSTSHYYVTHEGKERGPFDLRMIEAMVLAGQFSASVPIRKDKTEKWIPFDSEIRRSPQSNGGTARPKKNYGWDSPANILLIVVGSLVALLVIGGNLINDLSKVLYSNSYFSPNTGYTPSTSSYTPPYSGNSVTTKHITYTPSKTTTDSSSSYTPPKSTYTSPDENSDSTLYRDAKGSTYRIPKSAHQRLLLKKKELEAMQQSINTARQELDSLDKELDRLEKLTRNRSSEYQIHLFNDKVDVYNTKIYQLQILIDDFNAEVAAYNAELERVGTLIR